MMKSLVYRSRAVRSPTLAALLGLLIESRGHNATHAITGVLLYVDGGYLQLLQGEPARVDALMERIARDPRHRDIEVLLDEEHARPPLFPAWSMGFLHFSALEAEVGEGLMRNDEDALERVLRARAGEPEAALLAEVVQEHAASLHLPALLAGRGGR